MEINKIRDNSSNKSMHKEISISTTREDLSEILHKFQDYKHHKLTIGMFFEFMKVAYQVSDHCKSITTIFTTDNKFDWDKLAKINVHLETSNNTVHEKGINSNAVSENKNSVVLPELELKTYDMNLQNSTHFITSSIEQIEHEQTFNYDKNAATSTENCNRITETSSHVDEAKAVRSTGVTENLLISLMKTNLSDILHEGLLDSVLPYMIPKSTVSQPVIKKSIINNEIKKSNSLSNNIDTKVITSLSHKEKEKDKSKANKRSMENEVEIHVCDEEKNIKKNFHCPQKLLIQKMRYFADITAGQKLEEIDISVHCDIVIFDWLMRWVKKDMTKKSEWPSLEPSNVIPIMVSASFLQMEPLLENCLQYCHDNMSDILKTSTILTCLDDNLLTRLVERFTNEDVEALKDKKDKIQSKLFCKLIISLAAVMPDNKKGHYSSLATLFRCSKCGKSIVQSVSYHVPCIASAMVIDNHGHVYSKHVRDLSWTLNDYIITLRTELRSWRKVYWRLWGRYPCCSQRAYRFEVLSNREGCRYREHIPNLQTQRDISILNIFSIYREVIAMEPPQLFFPEKITRLVARDVSIDSGKLMCKSTMWWAGLELAPQRPKLGLLGKIWSGTGLRRSSQTQDLQKISLKVHQQTSFANDISSITSSITESDEDDVITIDEDCSIDEESYNSEESLLWSTLKTKNKNIKRSKYRILWKNNGRSWNSDLSVRHNQDNQREFEEKASLQMVALLTKRVSADSSLLVKSLSKHNRRKNQLNGGTYTKLEGEFRDQLNQCYKNKNTPGKYFLRMKSTKS
ncbi:SANT and BTB domain regulator of class switch recombination isoform X3 [Augochlora pura]